MDDIDRICANLRHMADDIVKAVEKQMRAETKRIQADAKRLAPVGTGQLRNSVTADVARDAATGDIVGTVGTNVAHAMFNELGTGPAGAASQKDMPAGAAPKYRKNGWTYKDPKTGRFIHTEGLPARPFLYPAYKQNEARVKENIAKAIRRAQKARSKGGGDNV